MPFACDVAVTVIVEPVSAGGAVYRPELVIVPHDDGHAAPDRLHVTDVLPVPVTVAANCCCALTTTWADSGATVTAIGANTVTVAVACLLGSACAVAVTVTVGGFGTELGAVYMPAVLIAPQALPEQPVPLTFQVTFVLLVPVTVAMNCFCCPVVTCAVAGATETTIFGVIVTTADAERVESACEVAVTFTLEGVGCVDGAVYSPLCDTVPQDTPEHPMPPTLQVTAVLLVPVTCELNCWV